MNEELKQMLQKWNDGCEWGKSHSPSNIVERTIDLTPTEIWLLTQFSTRMSNFGTLDAKVAEAGMCNWMDVLAEKYDFIDQRHRALAVPPCIQIFTEAASKGMIVP